MKRLTRQQKEDQARTALLRRLTDIYSGAMGQEWGQDEFATAEILSRVLPAIQELFSLSENKSWVIGHHCLDRFDTASSATNHLFDNGIRA